MKRGRRGAPAEPKRLADVPGGDYVELDDGAYMVRFHLTGSVAVSPRAIPNGAIVIKDGAIEIRKHEARHRAPPTDSQPLTSYDPIRGDV